MDQDRGGKWSFVLRQRQRAGQGRLAGTDDDFGLTK